MNTEEAVKRALNGEEEGFEYLYNKTKTDKFYLALKFVGNEETARDVLQDSYLKAWQRLGSLKDASKFDSWFSQIVVNTAKTELEKRKRNPLELRDVIDNEEESDFSEMDLNISEWENLPELTYTQEETKQLVNELLESLPEEQRVVVLAVMLGGLTTREVAESLGCPEATVKSRLNYGKGKLKKKAEELQKKGYQLYSLAPIAFLMFLLRSEKEVFAAETSTLSVLEGCKSKVCGQQAIKSVGASTTTKAAVGKGILASTAGKIATGLVAAVIIGGAGFAVFHSPVIENETVEDSKDFTSETVEDSKDFTSETVEDSEDISSVPVEDSEDEGLDPFFDYEARVEIGTPGTYGESGYQNIVEIDHVKEFTGENIFDVNEEWEANSVNGYVSVRSLVYTEKNAREAEFPSNGNEYVLFDQYNLEIPNGTPINVEKGITIGAEHVWGIQAKGETVTIYKVSAEGTEGYMLQNAFNGSPSDVN